MCTARYRGPYNPSPLHLTLRGSAAGLRLKLFDYFPDLFILLRVRHQSQVGVEAVDGFLILPARSVGITQELVDIGQVWFQAARVFKILHRGVELLLQGRRSRPYEN